jgi:hypothetical protein
LQVVKRRIVHLADGGRAHVHFSQGWRGGQLGGEHLHHGLDHIAVRSHGGGHAAGLRLYGAADLDKTGLDRAGAAVMVVVLALAEAPLAGAPAHVAVAGVLGVRIQADDQACGIDQLVKGFAPFGQEQLVVQVVAGGSRFGANFAFNDQHKGLGPTHPPLAVGKVQHRVTGYRGCGGVECRGVGHDEGSGVVGLGQRAWGRRNFRA